MKKLFFFFVLLLSSIGMNAETFEVNGIQYNVLTTSPDYTVEVSGYNSSYAGDLELNGTVSYNGQSYKIVSIANWAFGNCTKNLVVNDLPYCTSIGFNAFYYCSNLTNIGDLTACTSIGEQAFFYCTKLISVGNLSACTSIGNSAFNSCSSMTSIGDLSACTSIGSGAFYGCSSMTSIGDLSACASIGSNAFNNVPIESITMPATPPVLSGAIMNNGMTFLVPAASVATYRATEYWSDIKMQVISKDATHTWDVTAPVLTSIGADQFENVMTLKVSGNIDSDDIMYMRNKMSNLHHLDLTDVTIVACDKEYYSGFRTSDNSVGGFFDMIRLRTVKLPTSAKKIEGNAFTRCIYLNDVTIPEGIERIDDAFGFNPSFAAFMSCSYLYTIQLPEGMTYIGSKAFALCGLKAVAFPSTLSSIGANAFEQCPLVSLSLPEHLISINSNAFSNNSRLTTLRIPSSLESIGTNAFLNCSNLKNIYTYTVQPITINSNTFSTYAAATLHCPTQGFNDYYASPTWGQFPTLTQFDEPYKYFYITDDFVLLSGKRFDSPEGEDLDINAHAGSSITIEGETEQEVGNIDIHDDGSMGASIIPDNNLTAKTVTFYLTVPARTWRFFCFPFRVYLNKVVAPGAYVFRRYDGNNRALGNSGWASLPAETEYLEAGVGYIYQCNNAGTLKITVSTPDFSWATSTKTNTLTAYAAASDQNASWNFIGNPMINYYDIDDMHYTAPLTVWNGTSYVAYRPGDDNYQLQPFEAFFVQKPNDSSVPTYDKGKRMGHNAAVNLHNNKAAARRMNAGQRDRYLLNLVLSNGEQQDQTRVVFNEKKTANYERECDAAKFMSMEQVPQLYTLEQQVSYAINERQQGSVQVGFMAPKAGTYTLKAERMDMKMVLKDNVTGTSFELKNGEYTFESEAGTFNQRFLLMPAGEPTGIETATTTAETDSPAYRLDGRRAEKGAKGVVVENGKKVVK